jgi:hypothetical protein
MRIPDTTANASRDADSRTANTTTSLPPHSAWLAVGAVWIAQGVGRLAGVVVDVVVVGEVAGSQQTPSQLRKSFAAGILTGDPLTVDQANSTGSPWSPFREIVMPAVEIKLEINFSTVERVAMFLLTSIGVQLSVRSGQPDEGRDDEVCGRLQLADAFHLGDGWGEEDEGEEGEDDGEGGEDGHGGEEVEEEEEVFSGRIIESK